MNSLEATAKCLFLAKLLQQLTKFRLLLHAEQIWILLQRNAIFPSTGDKIREGFQSQASTTL